MGKKNYRCIVELYKKEDHLKFELYKRAEELDKDFKSGFYLQ